MNKFLFITHLTPSTKRSVFRQSLIDIYFEALRKQTYSNWSVLIFGEEEKVEGPFNYFILKDGTRDQKFEDTKKLLNDQKIKNIIAEADYIIKLDDDDIISPNLLERLKDFDADLYYDRFHTFIDSSSGVVTQQERNWIASTCVHKKELILSSWNGEGASPVGNLLYTDHSKAWHLFYANKNKVPAPKENPIYLRVLSPTSITSGALQGPPKTIQDVSMQKYYGYLQNFGNWKAFSFSEFDNYLNLVAQAWKQFSGAEQQPLPKRKSFLKKIFGKD